ncbi:hypothetical protein M0811_14652 [Anaeramoeba ignava]|uniref:Uncharacterized protein n=1 Tax=Anaeramoeba ignava TaxID=1746090 RepID=A0A9Q0LU52_ANAIG|nr:hypothetical protein M0811_14652 [Anaeramoeba ignava]
MCLNPPHKCLPFEPSRGSHLPAFSGWFPLLEEGICCLAVSWAGYCLFSLVLNVKMQRSILSSTRSSIAFFVPPFSSSGRSRMMKLVYAKSLSKAYNFAFFFLQMKSLSLKTKNF